MTRMHILPILGLLVSLACASGQPGQGIEPDDSDITVHAVNRVGSQVTVYAMYDTAPARRVGVVPADAEATFKLFYQTGDLRMVVDYPERRRVTSNGIVDLQPGDVLDLTISVSQGPRLVRRS
ncbi:MAG: hypothetical protein JSV86_18385 [Gemmatimonadota bacterium]|nr:MAG: hypothetical protein JSV86_18385 [Gemmatimonadota bacterium]